MRKQIVRLCDIIANETIRRIKFLYGVWSFRPDMASLNIADRCCLKCIMCSQWRTPAGKELDTGQWKEILLLLKNARIRSVNFSGGEPLLRKDLEELIIFAKSLGLFVSVSTNGFLLNKSRAESLVNAGVDFFAISVDALNGNFDLIRGVPGAFDQVRQGIQELKRLKGRSNFVLQISYVLMKPTLDFFEDVYAFSVSMGAELVICLFEHNSYFLDVAKDKERFLFSDLEKQRLGTLITRLKYLKKVAPHTLCGSYRSFDSILEYFNDPRQVTRPCVVSQKRLFLDSMGRVYGGCWASAPQETLLGKEVEDLYRSVKYRKALKNMYFKKCAGCACGYIMNNRYFIDDYLER